MTMSRKAPPHKKRHTKPCKFFQVNRCPHPADVCNFAHIIASPSDTGSSIYRHYPDYYVHDTLCRYSYGPRDIPLTPADSILRVDTKNLGQLSPYQQITFNGPHTPPYSYDDSEESLNLFKPRSSTRPSTKQKNLKYKSKPCRFFPTERGCPKGSLCTFIHDELKHQIPSPVKDSNLKEESCRKNYFPVPWRVIGGGVRVGITETEDLEDSDLFSTANTSRPVDHSALKLENVTPIKILSRKRSNSNPLAPSPHSLQFKVEHLFSAESP